MVQDLQKPLSGPGCEERREAWDSVRGLWARIIRHEELAKGEWERMERYYRLLCHNIASERRRIGGDWAVAGCLIHSKLREFVRASLGPEVLIVVLNMAEDDIRSRILSRHEGSSDIQKSLLV